MGTKGYQWASRLQYQPAEVILEIGMGESTHYLAERGPDVWTIDARPQRWSNDEDYAPEHVHVIMGYAENVLRAPDLAELRFGFAWLDGWDFPYGGVPEGYYVDQAALYEERGQDYSQEASRQSHLTICQLIAARTHVIAFDDTWQTHAFLTDSHDQCAVTVPPATYPAPALAMNEPMPGFIQACGLPMDHPHHNDPDRGWDGKGGTAIPFLLACGFRVVQSGLGLVVLEKGNDL